jgi:hypothetical protein
MVKREREVDLPGMRFMGIGLLLRNMLGSSVISYIYIH